MLDLPPTSNLMVRTRRRRWPARVAGGIIILPLLLSVLYAAAGFGLGALSPGPKLEPVAPGEGVAIFVVSNGYHASLVLPLRAAGIDWAERFPARDFTAASPAATHVMLGWGERDFYMNTRTLADLQPATGLRAVAGLGGAVMHAALIGEPALGPAVRQILLPQSRYAELAAFVEASFARDAEGKTVLHPGKGYGAHDAFYAATGRYTLFNTCNEWVGRGLRTAGVPTGIWTPFASSLLRQH